MSILKNFFQKARNIILHMHRYYPKTVSTLLAFFILMSFAFILYGVMLLASALLLYDPFMGLYIILTILGLILLYINFIK